MLPLIGAKVEKETKDGFDLWCEEGRLNVAEKKSEEKMKSKNHENITDHKFVKVSTKVKTWGGAAWT